jgi:hypothetical protein
MIEFVLGVIVTLLVCAGLTYKFKEIHQLFQGQQEQLSQLIGHFGSLMRGSEKPQELANTGAPVAGFKEGREADFNPNEGDKDE